MRLVLYLFGALLATVFGFWAYNVNYDTQEAMQRVQRLQSDLARERQSIAMLRAEWVWLNRPDRLAALVAEYNATLGLVPLDPAHFASLPEIAFPLPPRAPGWDGLTVADIEVTILPADLDAAGARRVTRPLPKPLPKPLAKLLQRPGPNPGRVDAE
ncbi:MAG: cell division protein FtsL [Pseudomonadota bacterium]